MLVESLGGGFMSQGSESAPQDLQDAAAQLIEKLASSWEHVAVIALPDTAPSFFADIRSNGPDIPAGGLGWERVHEAIAGALTERLQLHHGLPANSSRLVYEMGLPLEAVSRFQKSVDALMLDARQLPEGAVEPEADEWGPVISDEKAARLEQANLKLQVEHRRQELRVSMSRSEAADVLGVSPQTVSEWVSQRKLVGLKDGREWRFPAWQFTPDSAEPVLPDLDRLMAAFPGGEVSLSRWMNRPNDNFDGRTPAQEMARDSGHVLAIVETLAVA